jgi:transcription antitermination factor NusA-like protein
LVAEVKDSNRGPMIILSRTHRDFLRRLLETEVPEIYHGVVEIRSIAVNQVNVLKLPSLLHSKGSTL